MMLDREILQFVFAYLNAGELQEMLLVSGDFSEPRQWLLERKRRVRAMVDPLLFAVLRCPRMEDFLPMGFFWNLSQEPLEAFLRSRLAVTGASPASLTWLAARREVAPRRLWRSLNSTTASPEVLAALTALEDFYVDSATFLSARFSGDGDPARRLPERLVGSARPPSEGTADIYVVSYLLERVPFCLLALRVEGLDCSSSSTDSALLDGASASPSAASMGDAGAGAAPLPSPSPTSFHRAAAFMGPFSVEDSDD